MVKIEPQHLVEAVYALARKPPKLLKIMLQPQDIVRLAWSYEKLQVYDPKMFAVVGLTIRLKLNEFQPSQLVQLASSFARIQHKQLTQAHPTASTPPHYRQTPQADKAASDASMLQLEHTNSRGAGYIN
eukprot:gene26447-17546_t